MGLTPHLRIDAEAPCEQMPVPAERLAPLMEMLKETRAFRGPIASSEKLASYFSGK